MDVLGVRSSRLRRLAQGSGALGVSNVNLEKKEIGDKCAAEAVAAMLPWNAPTLTVLWLGYRRHMQRKGVVARDARDGVR